MTSDVYDPDDAFQRSPPLKPLVIKYELDPPKPPFLGRWPPDGGSDSVSMQGGSHGHPRPQPKSKLAPLGDAVLLRHLAPNRPDIADIARDNPLVLDPEDDSPDRTGSVFLASPKTRLGQTAAHALSLISDPRLGGCTVDPPAALSDSTGILERDAVKRNGTRITTDAVGDVKQDSRSPKLSLLGTHLGTAYERRPSDDTLATSPLAKYAISPSDRPAQELLPALQSPPQSNAGGSPDNTKSLPSLHTALGDQLGEHTRKDFPSRIGTSPFPLPSISGSSTLSLTIMRDRSLSGQPPSPFSHMTPGSSREMTSPASQSIYRKGSRNPELSYPASTFTVLTQSSPTTKNSSANYPTPTEPKPVEPERSTFATGAAQPNGNPSGGSFRCDYPGCKAPPFHTQYLLNSHANVHSTERPHLCPVEGCSRGISGKGFKRKNEMIRHGLVHQSPGYVCPFCTEQQHRYPRPDNLQRHVRVHHVDKNKDDPDLRKVLAQRPEGSTRGRRRRTHSQV